jgi:hypothetical protein
MHATLRMKLSIITTYVLIFTQIFTADSFVHQPSHFISKQFLSARRTELYVKTGEQEKPSAMAVPSDDFAENKEQPVDALIPVAVNLGEPANREEKFNTIQAEINAKVAALKKEQQWDNGGDEGAGEAFGKNPLATQNILITMGDQLKKAKLFDSVDELLTTYVLLLATTSFLVVYLLFLRENFDTFIIWWQKTDFDDNEILNKIFNQS